MPEISIPLDEIILDARLQMRAEMLPEVIDEYAENVDKLPPGKVVRTEEGQNLLTGGWHRYYAHQKAGKTAMRCQIRDGTFLDALEEAAGENSDHGARRSREDKRKAIMSLLSQPIWLEKSDRLLADACRVSTPFVAMYRKLMATVKDEGTTNVGPKEDTEKPEMRTGRDGKKHPAKRTRKEPEENNGAIILCDRCKRVGAIAGCKGCEYAREQAAKKKVKKKKVAFEEGEIKDDDGVMVPVRIAKLFAGRPLMDEAMRLLNACSEAFKAIESNKDLKSIKPFGENAHYQKFFPTFRQARAALMAMRPSMVCKNCESEGCERCHDRGWLPKKEAKR